LAYGTGYVKKRKDKHGKRKDSRREKDYRPPAAYAPGRESTSGQRKDHDAEAAILEVGAGLAALARKQNRMDLIEGRRQGIAHVKREDSGRHGYGIKGIESSRGIAPSKPSNGPDEDGWESASDDESDSSSSVDSTLAYGAESTWGWGKPRPPMPVKRKSTIVDPKLFGPQNSLNGVITRPVGFGDVDINAPGGFMPPPSPPIVRESGYVAPAQPPAPTLRPKDKGYVPPPAPTPMHRENSSMSSASLQHVYPMPTSDPNHFEAARSSVVSAQDQPIYNVTRTDSLPLRQPIPFTPVSQTVYEQSSIPARSNPRHRRDSSGVSNSLAGAGLAGIAGAAIAAAREDKRGDRRDKHREDDRDEHERRNRRERRREEERRAEERRAEEDRDRRRESRRDAERKEHKNDRPRESRRGDGHEDRPAYLPEDRRESRREEKRVDYPRARNDKPSTREATSIPRPPPVDPFQYQVSDDAFEIADVPVRPRQAAAEQPSARALEKAPERIPEAVPQQAIDVLLIGSSIERGHTPAIVTVERVPRFARGPSPAPEPISESSQKALKGILPDAYDERHDRDRERTQEEAEHIYEEVEHFTAPLDHAAIGAAVAAVTADEVRHPKREFKKGRRESYTSSTEKERDLIQEEADRVYRETILARKIASEREAGDATPRVVTPPAMEEHNAPSPYDGPNADFELDHVMHPEELKTFSPVVLRSYPSAQDFGPLGSAFDPAILGLSRPLLNLVRPTPSPEAQKLRQPKKASKSEGTSSSTEPVHASEASRDIVTASPPTSEPKNVSRGEDETRHFDVVTPYDEKSEPVLVPSTDRSVEPAQEAPRKNKSSHWGALRGAFIARANEIKAEEAAAAKAAAEKEAARKQAAEKEAAEKEAAEKEAAEKEAAEKEAAEKEAADKEAAEKEAAEKEVAEKEAAEKEAAEKEAAEKQAAEKEAAEKEAAEKEAAEKEAAEKEAAEKEAAEKEAAEKEAAEKEAAEKEAARKQAAEKEAARKQAAEKEAAEKEAAEKEAAEKEAAEKEAAEKEAAEKEAAEKEAAEKEAAEKEAAEKEAAEKEAAEKEAAEKEAAEKEAGEEKAREIDASQPNLEDASNTTFEYRDVVVEPETEPFEHKSAVAEADTPVAGHTDLGPPPAVGAKPTVTEKPYMPGAFGDDIDFAATVAAGLEDSGFDPNIVFNDAAFIRRSSPPGSDVQTVIYHPPFAETVTDLGVYEKQPQGEKEGPLLEEVETRDISDTLKAEEDTPAEDIPFTKKLSKKEQRKLEKAAEKQARERELEEAEIAAIPAVEEPESFTEYSVSKKKDKKSKKSRKSPGYDDEFDDRAEEKVAKISVPIDAFDDLREDDQTTPLDEWAAPKKSKKKSKRDSEIFEDAPESLSRKDSKKDKSRKKETQYAAQSDIGPSLSTGEIDDGETRSVVSETDKKTSKKNGGFFGLFGSSKPDPEPEKQSEEAADNGLYDATESKSVPGISNNGTSNGNGHDENDNNDWSTNTKGKKKKKKQKNGATEDDFSSEKDSFLANAGTLGAGVGLVGAAATIAVLHQHSKASDADSREFPAERSLPVEPQPITTEPEHGHDRYVSELIDPEITERVFRPSIDPQYGDLLPLPPSNPGSPEPEPATELPTLPDSRPESPLSTESVLHREKPTPTPRKSEHRHAAIKSPSISAVPLKFMLGNRSNPSSPGLARSSPITSPLAPGPDAVGFSRPRPRPTSWEASREIQPLFLLDPSRRDSLLSDEERPVRSRSLESEHAIHSRQSSLASAEQIAGAIGHSQDVILPPSDSFVSLPPLPGSRDSSLERVEQQSSVEELPAEGINTVHESAVLKDIVDISPTGEAILSLEEVSRVEAAVDQGILADNPLLKSEAIESVAPTVTDTAESAEAKDTFDEGDAGKLFEDACNLPPLPDSRSSSPYSVDREIGPEMIAIEDSHDKDASVSSEKLETDLNEAVPAESGHLTAASIVPEIESSPLSIQESELPRSIDAPLVDDPPIIVPANPENESLTSIPVEEPVASENLLEYVNTSGPFDTTALPRLPDSQPLTPIEDEVPSTPGAILPTAVDPAIDPEDLFLSPDDDKEGPTTAAAEELPQPSPIEPDTRNRSSYLFQPTPQTTPVKPSRDNDAMIEETDSKNQSEITTRDSEQIVQNNEAVVEAEHCVLKEREAAFEALSGSHPLSEAEIQDLAVDEPTGAPDVQDVILSNDSTLTDAVAEEVDPTDEWSSMPSKKSKKDKKKDKKGRKVPSQTPKFDDIESGEPSETVLPPTESEVQLPSSSENPLEAIPTVIEGSVADVDELPETPAEPEEPQRQTWALKPSKKDKRKGKMVSRGPVSFSAVDDIAEPAGASESTPQDTIVVEEQQLPPSKESVQGTGTDVQIFDPSSNLEEGLETSILSEEPSESTWSLKPSKKEKKKKGKAAKAAEATVSPVVEPSRLDADQPNDEKPESVEVPLPTKEEASDNGNTSNRDAILTDELGAPSMERDMSLADQDDEWSNTKKSKKDKKKKGKVSKAAEAIASPVVEPSSSGVDQPEESVDVALTTEMEASDNRDTSNSDAFLTGELGIPSAERDMSLGDQDDEWSTTKKSKKDKNKKGKGPKAPEIAEPPSIESDTTKQGMDIETTMSVEDFNEGPSTKLSTKDKKKQKKKPKQVEAVVGPSAEPTITIETTTIPEAGNPLQDDVSRSADQELSGDILEPLPGLLTSVAALDTAVLGISKTLPSAVDESETHVLTKTVEEPKTSAEIAVDAPTIAFIDTVILKSEGNSNEKELEYDEVSKQPDSSKGHVESTSLFETPAEDFETSLSKPSAPESLPVAHDVVNPDGHSVANAEILDVNLTSPIDAIPPIEPSVHPVKDDDVIEKAVKEVSQDLEEPGSSSLKEIEKHENFPEFANQMEAEKDSIEVLHTKPTADAIPQPKLPTGYSEDQLELARQMKLEFEAGSKKSKKGKKNRKGLSSASATDDMWSEVTNDFDPPAKDPVTAVPETENTTQPKAIDGFEAGFNAEQLSLAKQLQAEFESGVKKSKKGKKNRSTPATPKSDHESAASYFKEPQSPAPESIEAVAEIPRAEAIDTAGAPDGFQSGYNAEQLELARQLKEEFSSGSSKKSKKDKKRQSLLRSVTNDETVSQAAEESSDKAYSSNAVVDEQTPAELDGFGFVSKKNKKDKKRQGLLRSSSRDDEPSTSVTRDSSRDIEPFQRITEISGTPGPEIASESPGADAEDEVFSLKISKKDKRKSKQKGLALPEEARLEDASSESALEPSAPGPETVSETPAADPEDEVFLLKKSKKDKRKSKQKSLALPEDGPEDLSPEASLESSIPDLTSTGSTEIAAENPVPITEEPLGEPKDEVFTLKKSKKDKRKSKQKSLPLPQEEDPSPEPVLESSAPDSAATASTETETVPEIPVPITEEPSGEPEDEVFTLKKSKKDKRKSKQKSLPFPEEAESEDASLKSALESSSDLPAATEILPETPVPITEEITELAKPSKDPEDEVEVFTLKKSKKDKRKSKQNSLALAGEGLEEASPESALESSVPDLTISTEILPEMGETPVPVAEEISDLAKPSKDPEDEVEVFTLKKSKKDKRKSKQNNSLALSEDMPENASPEPALESSVPDLAISTEVEPELPAPVTEEISDIAIEPLKEPEDEVEVFTLKKSKKDKRKFKQKGLALSGDTPEDASPEFALESSVDFPVSTEIIPEIPVPVTDEISDLAIEPLKEPEDDVEVFALKKSKKDKRKSKQKGLALPEDMPEDASPQSTLESSVPDLTTSTEIKPELPAPATEEISDVAIEPLKEPEDEIEVFALKKSKKDKRKSKQKGLALPEDTPEDASPEFALESSVDFPVSTEITPEIPVPVTDEISDFAIETPKEPEDAFDSFTTKKGKKAKGKAKHKSIAESSTNDGALDKDADKDAQVMTKSMEDPLAITEPQTTQDEVAETGETTGQASQSEIPSGEADDPFEPTSSKKSKKAKKQKGKLKTDRLPVSAPSIIKSSDASEKVVPKLDTDKASLSWADEMEDEDAAFHESPKISDTPADMPSIPMSEDKKNKKGVSILSEPEISSRALPVAAADISVAGAVALFEAASKKAASGTGKKSDKSSTEISNEASSSASPVLITSKKGKKKKNKIVDRRSASDDIFDDPALWEGAEPRRFEEDKGDELQKDDREVLDITMEETQNSEETVKHGVAAPADNKIDGELPEDTSGILDEPVKNKDADPTKDSDLFTEPLSAPGIELLETRAVEVTDFIPEPVEASANAATDVSVLGTPNSPSLSPQVQDIPNAPSATRTTSYPQEESSSALPDIRVLDDALLAESLSASATEILGPHSMEIPTSSAEQTAIAAEDSHETRTMEDSVKAEEPKAKSYQSTDTRADQQWIDVPEEFLVKPSNKDKKKKTQYATLPANPPTEAEGEAYSSRSLPDTPAPSQANVDEAKMGDVQRVASSIPNPSTSHVEDITVKEPEPQVSSLEYQQSKDFSDTVASKDDVDDEDITERDIPKERHATEEHLNREVQWSTPSRLPVVPEETSPDYRKTPKTSPQESLSSDRSICDINRDSAFVTESPIPPQRALAIDHEYSRDSGVHLREWSDTPNERRISPAVSLAALSDDALARMSWPPVNEAEETVDLSRSPRPKIQQPSQDSPLSKPRIAAGLGLTGVALDDVQGYDDKMSMSRAKSPQIGRKSPEIRRLPTPHRVETPRNDRRNDGRTPEINRLQTPDQARSRPGSANSNRSSGAHSLRRSDRKLSGDLRSFSQRSQANLAKAAQEAERSPASSVVNDSNPIANEGRVRAKDMADVYVSIQQSTLYLE